jgi:hypothetical protein
MDFASVKSAAESLGNFLSQLSALERIVVTNETYESYSEPVKLNVNKVPPLNVHTSKKVSGVMAHCRTS